MRYKSLLLCRLSSFVQILISLSALLLFVDSARAIAGLQVEFSQQPVIQSIGESQNWTVTITNPDPIDATNARLVVKLPTDFLVTDSGGGTESPGPPHTLEWTGLTVGANGTTVSETFQTAPACNAGSGQTVESQIFNGSGHEDDLAVSQPVTVSFPILSIKLVDYDTNGTVTNASVGDVLKWKLIVKNSGDGNVINGANITFQMGNAFTYNSIISSTGHLLPSSGLTPPVSSRCG